MTDFDFPNRDEIPIGVELAFGADINGDQDLWDWTGLTDLFMRQEVGIARGRADESSDVTATAADMELDNPLGDLTPDNPSSAYWPDVDQGTPLRWWIEAGLSRLYLKPVQLSSAEVASTAALNITADLDVRIDLHIKSMDPSGVPAVIAGRASDANPYSWRIEIYPDRTVRLLWSATGTIPALSATSTTPVLPMSARTTLRITLDVNNGAAGRTITFYTGDSVAGPFTQVGPAVVQAGTTSISNVAAPLVVGSAADKTVAYAPDANVYAFQLRDGINGTPLANADFTAQISGSTSFVDSAGRTWSILGSAELSNRWFRIVGTVDSWAPTWPWGDLSDEIPGGIDEGEARVGLEVAGILRRLGQGASPLNSPLQRSTVFDPTVQAYWPMEDGKSSTQIASAVEGGSPMAVSGVVDFASNSNLPGSAPLPVFSATTALYGPVTGAFNGRWRAEWYVYVPAAPPGAVTLLRVTSTGSVVTWLVGYSGGNITVSGLDGFGTSITSGSTSATSLLGRWVNIQLAARQNGANVDWTLAWYPVVAPLALGATFTGSITGIVGGVTAAAYPLDTDGAAIAMGHLSVRDVSGVAVPSNAALGWAGEVAAARMARLCMEQSISFRLIGAGTTTAPLGVQRVATLLALLDDAQDADAGILYERPDAVGLLYRTRESLYNQPPNMILDAHLGQLQNPLQPLRDDQRLRNDVTVTRVGGSSARVIDQASIDKRGTYDDSVTLDLYADTQILDAAGWRLHQGTVPGMRYATLSTNLGVAPEIIDAWLTMDVGGRAEAINLPPQLPGVVDVMVEGYGETISPFDWKPEMNCSPASVWDVGVINGDGVTDQYLLRLDTDGSILAVAVDGDDTAFAVTVTEGPLWTADNAETPFDIRIDGERVTVTDVAAAAGAAATTGAGAAEASVSTVNFVAPSIIAPGATDLLICSWCSYAFTGTYTLPGGMTLGSYLGGGLFSCSVSARQSVGAGATGTKTAVYSVADRWTAVSVVVHGAAGTPVVQELVSSVAIGLAVTLTTATSAAVGSWVLAIQSWDWDPGNNMGSPSGTGWMPVADSVIASAATSRTRAWARRVTEAGVQSATFAIVGGVNDNHARLYILTGVTGITQDFTVVRSVNGVVRAHPVGTELSLWTTPVLAR